MMVLFVTPAQAGVSARPAVTFGPETPAVAGVTGEGR